MGVKTYVLLDNMDSGAPIYQQVGGGKRVQVKKRPFYRPHLQLTVFDSEGKSKTMRYKSSSNHIWQDEQKKEDNIDANVKWTQSEYRDPLFKNGSLTTNKLTLQKYLEAYPECEGSPYKSEEVSQKPKYKLLDKEAESKVRNEDVRKRIKAANKVVDETLEQNQEMLIRLNGSYFKTPDNKPDCENLLLEFIDDADDIMLEAVLKESKDINIDEKTTILIGKLMNEGILSFDAVQGKISKKKGTKWIEIRDMSDSYSLEERMRLFSDFLNTEDGKPLKTDLERDLKNLGKK